MQESEAERQSRTSVVQAIKSISNWWYWRPFRAPVTAVLASLYLPPPSSSPRTADHVTDRLREAAARRKAGGATTSVYTRRDDYWTPQLSLPSSASPVPDARQRQSVAPHGHMRGATSSRNADAGDGRGVSIDLTAPLLMAILSAGVAGYNREEMAGGGLQDHVGGAVALGVVNSFELKVVLAGVTWFIIGAAVAGLIQVLGRNEENSRK